VSNEYAYARPVERAFRDLIEQSNEASRAHAMNYTGMMYALLEKGVITPQALDEGRKKAKAVVDGYFGPTPEDKTAKLLKDITGEA